MKKSFFVLETIGTRGDVAPLLALAHELRRRGHDASLLAPSAFAPDAAELGIHFVPTTKQHLDHVGKLELGDFYFPAFQPVVDHLDALADAGRRPVVVNIDKTATSNLLCERYAWRGARLHLMPYKLRSLISPAWPFAAEACGPGREVYLRETLPRFLARCDTHPRLLAYINERRRALRLPPAVSATPNEPHLAAQICLFPEWYAPPPADWPSPLPLLGFPLPRARGELPSELAGFLQHGSAPLVFTTGTGVRDVEQFFAHAQDCCRRLGRRGVFLSTQLRNAPSNETFATFSHVELGLLLPHAALLVHHGGIGTLARAIEAGIPQIVSPLKYDQPDNAHRATELGLGALLPREQLSGHSLAGAALRLLGPAWPRTQLLAAQRSVRASDAIDACATLLEGIANTAVAHGATRPQAPSRATRRGSCPRRALKKDATVVPGDR